MTQAIKLKSRQRLRKITDDKDVIRRANELFWDENVTITQLEKRMRMGRVTLDRVLFTTREAWYAWKG